MNTKKKRSHVHANYNWSNEMKKFMCLAVLAIGMLFVATACGPAEIGSQSDVDGNNDVECTSDKDCADDEMCNDANECVEAASPECEEDADCDDDEFCADSGQCEPLECVKDSDCADDEMCNDANECVEAVSPECEEDADCEEGEVCTDDGVCEMEEETPECESDSDCTDDEMCNDDGECVEKDTGPECTSDDDCDNGESCKAEACVTDECTEDDDCSEGEVCEVSDDSANVCKDEGSDEESRKLKLEVTGDGNLYAIVCSYEQCSDTDNPAQCDNDFWMQGAAPAEGDSVTFEIELQKGRPMTKSVRMNCDLVPQYNSDCYDNRPPEEAGACADRWLAHGPFSPELKGTVKVTLDNESMTVDDESIVHIGAGDDASSDAATIFPFGGGSSVGISIPALESELGL